MTVEKTCIYNGTTYKVGETWVDPDDRCMSFVCTAYGIQSEPRVCPSDICPEGNTTWDDQDCCSTCGSSKMNKKKNLKLTH
ncbi:integumentary mucin B.1-like [Xiphophorus maculatus]|uniref:integumentary mucin B.1-like n=1 Tax=Xiphophorus maculatus TaxID=8083 RepID=UPI000C6D12A1|nr:integumentary mucin B.1-like [Xiphophorus maculatus]